MQLPRQNGASEASPLFLRGLPNFIRDADLAYGTVSLPPVIGVATGAAAPNNTGAPDCPWLYTTTDTQACLALGVATGNHSGNRQCVIALAVAAAKTGVPQLQDIAFSYVLLAQCHNPGAQQTITAAGRDAVVSYLRTFN